MYVSKTREMISKLVKTPKNAVPMSSRPLNLKNTKQSKQINHKRIKNNNDSIETSS